MRELRAAFYGVLVLVLFPATVARAQEQKTFFDELRESWAVAEVHLASPLRFRDGQILVFPGKLVDVVYARVGKPGTIMLVHELPTKDATPFFTAGDVFLAPLRLLPRYSYWRDNLPKTRQHGILGGRRYVFRGPAMAEAKRVARAYTATLAEKMPERAREQVSVVISALFASDSRLREDAVAELADYRALARDLTEPAGKRLAEFLRGNSAQAERVRLVEAIGRSETVAMSGVLEELAHEDSPLGAAALQALELLGKPASTGRLLTLAKAKSVELRSYALGTLAEQGKEEERALTAALSALASDDEAAVRVAVAKGLGRSGAARAITPLRRALYRGDGASRAAASALAVIGGEKVVAILKDAIVHGPEEAMIGSVLAMVELREQCSDCRSYLLKLHKTHKEKAIRDLIGIVLELHVKHVH